MTIRNRHPLSRFHEQHRENHECVGNFCLSTRQFTTDGRSAIDRVHHDDSIGLLLVDLVMPEIDGIETLKKFRRDAKAERLYTILLTARDSKDTKLRAFNNGFDDFLSKVASESKIVAKVRSASTPKTPHPHRRAHRHRQPSRQAPSRRGDPLLGAPAQRRVVRSRSLHDQGSSMPAGSTETLQFLLP